MNTELSNLTRRGFLGSAAMAAGAWAAGAGSTFALDRDEEAKQNPPIPATADACIFIWLPGGVAQSDTWDPKPHTPFQANMKGSELLSTFPRPSMSSCSATIVSAGMRW